MFCIKKIDLKTSKIFCLVRVRTSTSISPKLKVEHRSTSYRTLATLHPAPHPAHMFHTGVELLEAAGDVRRVGTGWRALDAALRGGLRAGTLTELCGESGAGKTQLALHATAHNWERGVVYVCTENAFPSQRLQQILESLEGHRPGTDYGARIYVEHLTEVEALQRCVRARLSALLARRGAALLVLDSVAAPFRAAYTDYAERAEHLRELGARLLQAAREHRVAVLCLNQMTTSFPADGEPETVPCLGLSWTNMLSTRLRVSKTDGYAPVGRLAGTGGERRDSAGQKRDSTGQKRDSTGQIQDSAGQICGSTGQIRDSMEEISDCQIRKLHVVFAPDLPNLEVSFIVTSSGIHSLGED